MYFVSWRLLLSSCALLSRAPALFSTSTPSIVVEALTLSAGQQIASRRKPNTILPPLDPDEKKRQRHATERKSLFDLRAVENWGARHDLKEHHLKTLYKFIMNDYADGSMLQSNNELHALSSFPSSPEERLVRAEFPKRHAFNLFAEFSPTCTSSIQRVEPSEGGYKFVIRLNSGKLVETVLIRHTRRTDDDAAGHVRYTVCVSSQVGCGRECSFCATGSMGLLAQLTSGEILEQVYLARNYLAGVASMAASRASAGDGAADGAADVPASPPSTTPTPRPNFRVKPNGVIRNVVFMGMGEPLDNYDEVHESLRGLTHQLLFSLSARHITVSTVGASAAKIRMLADEAPQVNLALSLHSALQGSRERLIPSARANPMGALGGALDYHAARSGRGAMLEYLLIDGVNDGDAEADALLKFCRERNENGGGGKGGGGKSGGVFVNLIPYNPTLAGDDFGYGTPSDLRIYAFHNRLRDGGVNSLVRWSSAQGRDANGACGQLALNSSVA